MRKVRVVVADTPQRLNPHHPSPPTHVVEILNFIFCCLCTQQTSLKQTICVHHLRHNKTIPPTETD
jgi:hypothetical protein